jgi:hypothetical protein
MRVQEMSAQRRGHMREPCSWPTGVAVGVTLLSGHVRDDCGSFLARAPLLHRLSQTLLRAASAIDSPPAPARLRAPPRAPDHPAPPPTTVNRFMD